MGNPFTPSFGVTPPLLVGRDPILEEFAEAVEDGPGSPCRALLVTGQRGHGKTVLLNALEDIARTRDWHVMSLTARPGIATELTQTMIPRELTTAYPDMSADTRITQVNVTAAGFGGGLTRARTEHYSIEPTLRDRLTLLADIADTRRGAGVLVTIDEVSRHAFEDLQVITQAIQHHFREGRQVMLAGAGLTHLIRELLQRPGTTFLRRAERAHLGPVNDDDVARALREPIRNSGKSICDDALHTSVAATQGYPFMVQLVGYQTWRNATAGHVDKDAARRAVTTATRRIGKLVTEPALRDLSATDRSFLVHMAVDDGPSETRHVADRMGVEIRYASVYRHRLIQAEIIHATGHGRIDFTLPHPREYLREHATHELLTDDGT